MSIILADQLRCLWRRLAHGSSGCSGRTAASACNSIISIAILNIRSKKQSAPVIPQPPALAPGTLLAGGRYLIQGYIGGGGFGHIYRAQDTMLRHYRALKEAFSSDLHARRQFQLEAEFLLNVRHPNLVSAYTVFEENGRLYLVMDYVDGLTLEDIAINHIHKTGRPLDEAQTLDWIIPICDAATASPSAAGADHSP